MLLRFTPALLVAGGAVSAFAGPPTKPAAAGPFYDAYFESVRVAADGAPLVSEWGGVLRVSDDDRRVHEAPTWGHKIHALGQGGGFYFAVGEQGHAAYSADGERWTAVRNDDREDLTSVWISAGGEVFALGESGAVLAGKGSGPLSRRATIAAKFMQTIWGRDPEHLYAAGDGGLFSSADRGKTWKQLSTDGWMGVVGTKDHLVLVNLYGEIRRSRDLSSWETVYSDKAATLYDVWASGGELCAVGPRGLILFSKDGGASWSKEPSGVDEELHGVFADDAGRWYAVGYQGVILRRDRGVWGALRSSPYDLPADFFAKAQHKDTSVVVGEKGLILRTDLPNHRWERIDAGVSDDLTRAFALENGDFWVVGAAGALLRSRDQGKSWEKKASGVGSTLHALAEDEKGRLYVAGGGGAILVSGDGERWKGKKSSSGAELFAIWAGKGEAYAAGAGGVILHSKDAGATWKSETSGVTRDLVRIEVRSDGTVHVFDGDNVYELVKKPGAKSWTKELREKDHEWPLEK
jgi:photosystem II stability/assembly factor-like uncharacterized protein